MPIQKTTAKNPITHLNLDGAEGNTFFIIAQVRSILASMGKTRQFIDDAASHLRNQPGYYSVIVMADDYCKGMLVFETNNDALLREINEFKASLDSKNACCSKVG